MNRLLEGVLDAWPIAQLTICVAILVWAVLFRHSLRRRQLTLRSLLTLVLFLSLAFGAARGIVWLEQRSMQRAIEEENQKHPIRPAFDDGLREH